MKKYVVKYTTTDGDLCSVCVEAESVEDAKIQARNDYWDIKGIINVTEIK